MLPNSPLHLKNTVLHTASRNCYLSLHVRVLKHLSEGGDVLFPHSLAAPNLHGLTNPLVDLP